jgi:predicted TIM-barrel fold metal-dependent hydrolase
MKDIYQLCDTFHLPVVFHTGLTAQKDTEQKFIRPQIFEEIAAENPDLVLILAHGGKPNWHTEAVDMITKFENVYVDTGLVEPKNWETVFPNLEKTSHKILFGSDFPVCGSYKVLLDKISDANIQKEFLENIMYWNGKRLLQKVLDKQIEIMPLLHKKLQSLANNQ